MKKVCIIMPAFMSVPSDNCGSVELLMNVLLTENDKLNIKLFSKKQVHINFFDKFLFLIYKFLKKYFHLKIFSFNRYYYKVFKFVKKEPFDLYIVEAGDIPKMEGLIKALSKSFSKEKLVYHAHMDLSGLEEKYKNLVKSCFGKFINVSDFINNRFIQSFNIDKNQTAVLYNCTCESDFKEMNDTEKSQFRSQFNFKSDDFILLYVGRLVEEKGILELILALNLLNDTSVKLICCGADFNSNSKETEFISKLKKYIQLMEDRVYFTGYVPHKDLYKYYQISDCLVIPSKWEEPAGIVAIEGLINKIPIIATKSGGMIEYLNEECSIMINKDCYLIENLKNAIYLVKNDSSLCNNLASCSAKRANLYNKRKYYDDFVMIVENFCN